MLVCLINYQFDPTNSVFLLAKIARNLVEHSQNSVGSMATTFPSDDPRFTGKNTNACIDLSDPL
jgi:hypothetical protein